jgi:hypothetical protein
VKGQGAAGRHCDVLVKVTLQLQPPPLSRKSFSSRGCWPRTPCCRCFRGVAAAGLFSSFGSLFIAHAHTPSVRG